MLKRLYEDVGEKIKRLAVLMFILQAISYIIAGIVIISNTNKLEVLSIFMIILGPMIAWISSWLLYGFGEMIDKTCENERHNREILKMMKEAEQESRENKSL